MSEHLSECSSPFCNASSDESFELFLGWSAPSPGTRLRCKSASVFRDEISAPSQHSKQFWEVVNCLNMDGAYSFSIFTRTNQQ